MNAKEAKKIFEEQFPDREVIHAGRYKNGFIFVAPDKKLGEFNDTTNPIYTIDAKTKEIKRAFVQEDPYGIGNALSVKNRIF